MNKFGDQFSPDQNNNEEDDGGSSKSDGGLYIERHLELGHEDDFLIVPNGGTGDCMFKAVSQAVYNGDESKHRDIRRKVVNFIISQRWEKFSEFIEVQHINGNTLLQRQWSKDPKHAYRLYMNLSGTLGSSSELTAAAELYRYNFATIQEYCNGDQRTYRVENCILFDQGQCDFHYFYFTGDFDNGHWEYLRSLSDVKTEDGTYRGRHKILIEGEDISTEAWLLRETDNNNVADQLKILTNRSLYARRPTGYPFELSNCFRFERDGLVKINGVKYAIEDVECTDLYSVLALECLQNEGSAHEMELVLIKHRYSYFEDINYKLITQPWSHNFTTEAIKYCSYPCKGNIQDLICAADLYSFSFELLIKLEDTYEERGEEVHRCKFTHVDRWGGENDRILHFFMRLVPVGGNGNLIAKWWLLTPHIIGDKSSIQGRHKPKQMVTNSSSTISSRSGGKPSSVRVYEDGRVVTHYDNAPRTVSRTLTEELGRPSRTLSRQATPRPVMSKAMTPEFSYSQKLSDQEVTYEKHPRNIQKDGMTLDKPGPLDLLNMSGMTTSEDSSSSLRRDFASIFGADAVEKAYKNRTPSVQSQQEVRLVKKKIRLMDKLKPATGRDLANRPDKVRTVVRVKDRSNSNKEITYRGSGYMKADDVLSDLRSQGLIRLPSLPPLTDTLPLEIKNEFSFDKIFMGSGENQLVKEPKYDRDENFNLVQRQKSAASHISNENQDWLDQVFVDEPVGALVENEPPPIHPTRSNLKKFSKTLVSYMSKDKLSVKRNKVSPKISYALEEDRQSHESSIEATTPKASSTFRPFLTGLAKLISRISKNFRRMSRAIKRGYRRRYQRYQKSSSIFSFTSQSKKRTTSNHENLPFENPEFDYLSTV